MPLTSVSDAQALQQARINANLGKYNLITNNCLTNAADIAREGGGDVPTSDLRLWVKRKLKGQ